MSDPGDDGPGAPNDVLGMTRALVAIPSVNPDLVGDVEAAGEEAMARCCAAWLKGWGYDVDISRPVPGRASVLARRSGARPGRTLLLNGHLDTVGTEGMTIDPFDPVVRDGRLYGRGSCDMKSGIAAVLEVARSFAGREDAAGELIVALTADEEYGSVGMSDLLNNGLRADAAVVTEPTSLALMSANKGFLVIRTVVRGFAAHGSRPDLGRDAIRGAGRILAAFDVFEREAAEAEPHPLLGRGTIHAGTIRGGSAVSVYPDRCELVLEARCLPGEDQEVVVARFSAVLAEARRRDPDLAVEVEPVLFRPGTEIHTGHELVRELSDALRAEGEEVRIEGMSAWVESALLNEAGIPALCFGPGSIEQAHTADEFVPVDEVERGFRVLERFARGFLS